MVTIGIRLCHLKQHNNPIRLLVLLPDHTLPRQEHGPDIEVFQSTSVLPGWCH